MTLGELMCCGGIALAAVGVVLVILCIPVFTRQRKRLEEQIKNGG